MINQKRTYGYFRDSYLLKKSTKGWFSFDCPKCGGDHKAAVHFDYEIVKCWVCAEGNQWIIDFVAFNEGLKQREVFEMLNSYKEADIDLRELESNSLSQISDVELPDNYQLITQGEGMLGRRAREYLTGRGFSLKKCERLGLGYVNKSHEEFIKDFFGYIIIPFKKDGKLYYYIARDYIGNGIKYKNPAVTDFGIGKSELLFNEDALNKDVVFATEGWACATTLDDKNHGGTAILGNTLANLQKTKIISSPCSTVVIAGDVGFYKHSIKMGMELMNYKDVYVLNMDKLKAYGKDPNDIGKEKIHALWKDTKKLTMGTALADLI